MEPIVAPDPAKVIGRAGEALRLLMTSGLTYNALQLPINSPEARRKIVDFWLEAVAAEKLPVFKSLELGVFKNVQVLHKELIEAGHHVSRDAEILMSSNEFRIFPERRTVDVVIVEARGLTQARLIARQKGLEFCTAEVGPLLRLAHKQQGHEDECDLIIAMEPIYDGGFESVFALNRPGKDEATQLDTVLATHLIDVGGPTMDRYIFAQPRT